MRPGLQISHFLGVEIIEIGNSSLITIFQPNVSHFKELVTLVNSVRRFSHKFKLCREIRNEKNLFSASNYMGKRLGD